MHKIKIHKKIRKNQNQLRLFPFQSTYFLQALSSWLNVIFAPTHVRFFFLDCDVIGTREERKVPMRCAHEGKADLETLFISNFEPVEDSAHLEDFVTFYRLN